MARDPNMEAPPHTTDDQTMGHNGTGTEMSVPPAPAQQVHHTQHPLRGGNAEAGKGRE